MAQIPPLNFFPTGVPTQDPALAGYLTQLAQSVQQWATQVTATINALEAALTSQNIKTQ